MPTFAPGPDDDFSDTLKLVSQLQRTVNKLIAQALPKPTPALQVQRAMGQALAQQINQRATLSASLAVNRLTAVQRLAMANASARLPEIVSSSFSPLVEVQAKVARDALLGNQWQRTMLRLYPALRAREALENISRLTRGLGNVYYPPRPEFGPYQPRTIPESPRSREVETAEVVDTGTTKEIASSESYEIGGRDAEWRVYWWVHKHSPVIAVVLDGIVVLLTATMLIVMIF